MHLPYVRCAELRALLVRIHHAFTLHTPTPPEFLIWTLSSLNLDTFVVEILNGKQYRHIVEPDETARDEPFHLDLHYW